MPTNVDVSNKVHRKLVKMKYDLGAKSYSEVLDRLFKLVTKFKLANELEDLKK